MSTRSIVAIKNADGSYDTIYCHFDGYIKDGVGEALRKDHATEEAARALIAAGDHSSIAGGCSPYAERGDEDWEDIKPRHFVNESELKAMLSKSWTEYLHTFVDGGWASKAVR